MKLTSSIAPIFAVLVNNLASIEAAEAVAIGLSGAAGTTSFEVYCGQGCQTLASTAGCQGDPSPCGIDDSTSPPTSGITEFNYLTDTCLTGDCPTMTVWQDNTCGADGGISMSPGVGSVSPLITQAAVGLDLSCVR